MNKDEIFKLPRLYTEYPISDKVLIPLASGQAHYLKNVLRRNEGDYIRLFDGNNGEWLGQIIEITKKSGQVKLEEQTVKQPKNTRRIHLLFAPIKKSRMDWLIEKAVELGTTDFHPIITQNTEVRKINEERLRSQIFESAEQCERLEIPQLHEIQKLDTKLKSWDETIPVLACLERFNAPHIHKSGIKQKADVGFIIGPEGGFTTEEKEMISDMAITVSLGKVVLRCETAVVKALVLLES